MSYCPIDGKPCCDDLCHGGGCIQTGFSEPMDRRCERCKQLVPGDEMIYDICFDCRESLERNSEEDEE